MAIKVKEILENVKDYKGSNDELNATDVFKKLSNDKFTKLKEVLDNDQASSTELIKTLDDLVYVILDYRYNIVDYGHYTDDKDDNSRRHLKVSK